MPWGAADLTEDRNIGYRENVFSPACRRSASSPRSSTRMQAAVGAGGLDPELANTFAEALKEWALEKGATHYTHWFQPLTGLTAEKHDSFSTRRATAPPSRSSRQEAHPGGAGRVVVSDGRHPGDVRGARLHGVGPDVARLRPRESQRGAAVHPDGVRVVDGRGARPEDPAPALDWTRSRARPRARAGCWAWRPSGSSRRSAEQEYFLIDEQYYYGRPDLVNTGRTLFGAKPPKGHELDDHYFGLDPERILAYMMDTERELQRLGIPVKTRHNEVAPNQYELAPIFENSNVASDHQQLTMQLMQTVARRYGLVCLLHEKPFAGVNGSGKHNNWSMGTDTGVNLLDPGDTPQENLTFLFFCSAVLRAVNRHQALLRASVANAGQDHRLGANEAPPAIISIFLGSELEGLFEEIAAGDGGSGTPKEQMALGTALLPELPKHGGDRNRTSPFAFTGNKFEFRAVGSSASLSLPNTVLNTIVAQLIDELSTEVEAAVNGGSSLSDAVLAAVRKTWAENQQIVFGGDNYSEEWHAEAAARGLMNLRTTPDALPWLVADQTVEAFEQYAVLSERELHARYEVLCEQYATKINIEAETAADIARTQIVPAAVRHLAMLREGGTEALIGEATEMLSELVFAVQALEGVNEAHPETEDVMVEAEYVRDTVIPAMDAVRDIADRLERVVADDLWSLPKYWEMLFIK